MGLHTVPFRSQYRRGEIIYWLGPYLYERLQLPGGAGRASSVLARVSTPKNRRHLRRSRAITDVDHLHAVALQHSHTKDDSSRSDRSEDYHNGQATNAGKHPCVQSALDGYLPFYRAYVGLLPQPWRTNHNGATRSSSLCQASSYWCRDHTESEAEGRCSRTHTDQHVPRKLPEALLTWRPLTISSPRTGKASAMS